LNKTCEYKPVSAEPDVILKFKGIADLFTNIYSEEVFSYAVSEMSEYR
jgi:hypothetical protein